MGSGTVVSMAAGVLGSSRWLGCIPRSPIRPMMCSTRTTQRGMLVCVCVWLRVCVRGLGCGLFIPCKQLILTCFSCAGSSPYVLAVGATQLINSTTPGPGANTSITLPPHCFVAPPPHCGGFQRPVICPQCSKSTTEAPVPGWSGGGFSLTSPTPAYVVASWPHAEVAPRR